MIKLLYTHFKTRLSDKCWSHYMGLLPNSIQAIINQYRRWQDRQARLFGKLLLLEALKKYGFASTCLNNISLDKFGKPFIHKNVDFNISHSDEYVICAHTNIGRLGIDIEKIKFINTYEFDKFMSSKQVNDINKSVNRYKKFYDLWTIKESVLKCDGRGLSIPLRDVHIYNGSVKLYENEIYIKEINVHPNYSCHLATNVENSKILAEEIKFI